MVSYRDFVLGIFFILSRLLFLILVSGLEVLFLEGIYLIWDVASLIVCLLVYFVVFSYLLKGYPFGFPKIYF